MGSFLYFAYFVAPRFLQYVFLVKRFARLRPEAPRIPNGPVYAVAHIGALRRIPLRFAPVVAVARTGIEGPWRFTAPGSIYEATLDR